MNRREFLMMVGVVSTGAIALTACGSGGGGGGEAQSLKGNLSCGDGGVSNYLNPGHAHTTLGLTAQQLAGAAPGDYELMGGGHSHFFRLTAADFTALKQGQTITKVDLEGHGHQLAISC